MRCYGTVPHFPTCMMTLLILQPKTLRSSMATDGLIPGAPSSFLSILEDMAMPPVVVPMAFLLHNQ